VKVAGAISMFLLFTQHHSDSRELHKQQGKRGKEGYAAKMNKE
jgi:hypothetical protein